MDLLFWLIRISFHNTKKKALTNLYKITEKKAKVKVYKSTSINVFYFFLILMHVTLENTFIPLSHKNYTVN